jgi:hypothetical protein
MLLSVDFIILLILLKQNLNDVVDWDKLRYHWYVFAYYFDKRY